MFGNKFSGDEIARNFHQAMKAKAIKKQANLAEFPEVKPEVKPEDFLITPEEPVNMHGKELENKIDEVSSYAKDKPCDKCHQIHYGDDCKTEEPKKQENMAEDLSYLVDKKAEYVLYHLGKIAHGLREKNKGFAADMVEATAIEIKDKAVKKAAEKIEVIINLKKMAHKSYQEGDRMTGDVISATIENIKKAKIS